MNISKDVHVVSKHDLERMLKQAYADAQNRTELNIDILINEVL